MLKYFFLGIIIIPLPVISFQNDNSENTSHHATVALSDISHGLKLSGPLTIFNMDARNSILVNELVMQLSKRGLQTCIFNEKEKFFKFIETNLLGSLEVTGLVFHDPKVLIPEIHARNLAHRLSLYVFFWNVKKLPKNHEHLNLQEPLRTVMITNPRKFVYRIYYNQASSANDGNMKLVNWFDGNNLGLNSEPILPDMKNIYKNFNKRVFIVPIIHRPPWTFISYKNLNESGDDLIDQFQMPQNDSDISLDISGRDHSLLEILSEKMNFKFKYIDVKSIISSDNITQPHELGLKMLQNREADLLFGDTVITSEKLQEIEFSFLTLPDSGAFLTHAPRRISEAFALVYPFDASVWPPLVFTVVIVGPILYFMVVILEKLKKRKKKQKYSNSYGKMIYTREIFSMKIDGKRKKHARILEQDGLLSLCVWFTCHIFLRQPANFPYDNNSVRLFSIILWLSSTYVLSDLYSAQLTSQLARPSKELPINTLQRLEHVLNKSESYKLLVETNSASHNILKNGIGIMNRLYNRMVHQGSNSTYLLNSVEEGVQVLLNKDSTVVFAGRQTLLFNMKRFGIKNFQLSEKLFTRYSAISLQKGCLFLDSLNENLMKLFEGGILDKITNDEYKKMYQSMPMDLSGGEKKNADQENGKIEGKMNGEDSMGSKAKTADEKEQTALNLRMLQGAFYLVMIGHIFALITFAIEIQYRKP